MTRITRTPARRRKPVKRMDWTPWREALKDDRAWVRIAQVWKPDDAKRHYRIVTQGSTIVQVLIEVFTIPHGEDLTPELAPDAGGLWRIPDIGTEVIVALPDGEKEHEPTVVGIRASRTISDRVSPDRMVLASNLPLEIIAPKVRIGPDPASIDEQRDGFVHGEGIDTLTGMPYWALGNASGKVFGNR